MSGLPFLKNKIPRIAQDSPVEKLVQGSTSDHIDDYCIGELMEAVPKKDVRAFRSAFEALFMNMFDQDGGADGRQEA